MRYDITPLPASARIPTYRRACAGGYRGTYLAARRQGAALTLPAGSGKRIYAVLLATGPGYGKVRIQAGGYARTVNLDSTVRRHRVIEELSH